MPVHSGIHFRSGPAGRRPALVDGPDVWEVIRVVRNVEATGERAVEEAAQWLGLGRDRVEAALRYYAEYGPEIDDWIARVDEAANRAHLTWTCPRRGRPGQRRGSAGRTGDSRGRNRL
jgi:GNAT superfamily N-acetyltransferase